MLFYLFAIALRFKLRSFQGILVNIILLSFAMLLTWQKDIRNRKDWFGHYYNDSAALIVRIAEPPTEKSKSYKAEGIIEAVYCNGVLLPSSGKLMLYFSKDSAADPMHYGDRILISKTIQRIKNSGNPGSFNYERYAAFQQLFHTVYLKNGEFILLPQKNSNPLRQIIFSSQKFIIDVLQRYLSPDKNIIGIAEALLIGYKEDLDKDLVQAYSNTGVVHIIAISGLHLGLIYVLLVWIFNRLPIIKRSRFLKVLLILSSLWFFSLLTGASASVLRSAVMFTCIVIGKNFFTQSSIYNSLAASAFILLCYDPYFLWDVGFQLSYLAVIGIVWLQQLIYRSVYIKNKWLDKLWNMMAVTLAAQVITFPICIYYFHQFPNLFLVTNMLAVPLSTVILFAELFLIAFSWIPVVSIYMGKVINLLIELMNGIIQTCDAFSFSRLDNIYADILTTWAMYIIVIASCFGIFYKKRSMFKIAALGLVGFAGLQTFIKIQTASQKKIIVYNVPQHTAIDFISGNKYSFYGDSILAAEGLLQNFHLKPGRINMQLNKSSTALPGMAHENQYWQFFQKKILLVDSTIAYEATTNKLAVDILIISKNPSIHISGITAAIKPSIIVFDSSNSLWKIANWKKECVSLALPCFSIPEQGAFVLNIEQ